MRTLHRYILVEYLKALALALAVFTGFAGAASLYKFSETAVKTGIEGSSLLPVAGYLLPYVLLYAMPMALFTAGIITFGRMASDNEFVAIRAAGINPASAVAPVFAAALACSLLCTACADWGLAAGFSAIRKSLLTAAPAVVQGALVPGRTVRVRPEGDDLYVVNVLKGSTGTPVSIAVFRGGRLERYMTAGAFDVRLKTEGPPGTAGSHVLRFKLRNGQMFTGLSEERPPGEAPSGWYRPFGFEAHRIEMPVGSGLAVNVSIGRRSQTMGLSQNLSSESDALAAAARCRKRVAYLSKQLQAGADPEGRLSKELKAESSSERSWREKAVSIRAELHRKLSMSFACIAFTMLGVPLGLAARARSRATGFALGAGVAFGVYYPLTVIGNVLSETGRVSVWAGTWAPVVLVTIVGTVWTLSAVRR